MMRRTIVNEGLDMIAKRYPEGVDAAYRTAVWELVGSRNHHSAGAMWHRTCGWVMRNWRSRAPPTPAALAQFGFKRGPLAQLPEEERHKRSSEWRQLLADRGWIKDAHGPILADDAEQARLEDEEERRAIQEVEAGVEGNETDGEETED